MNFTFIWAALGSAVVDWLAVAFKWRRLEALAKPAVILLLLTHIAVNLRAADLADSLTSGLLWFTLGLIFSLLGDVLLLPQVNRFLPGLGAFLGAQICYVVGFNPIPPLRLGAWLLAALIAALTALPAAAIFRSVSAALVRSNQPGLKRPALAYAAAISLMLYSALLTNLRGGWPPQQAMLVSLGAALFYLSDAILAWNRFVTPLRNGRLLNLIAYHLGQTLIVAGAALQHLRT